MDHDRHHRQGHAVWAPLFWANDDSPGDEVAFHQNGA